MSASRPPLLSLNALSHVLVLTAIVAVVFSASVLLAAGGCRYYRTPLATRGYDGAHAWLRPSGPAGQTFGVAGTLVMCMPFLYMVRKRLAALRAAGNIRTWLEVHIFCGLVGPLLITFHTSFKFNGIVSVAYWSMVLVMLSGFVGRYLYVRIPRTIRGVEVSRAELESHLEGLKDEIAWSLPLPQMEAIERFEREVVPEDTGQRSLADLLFGRLAFRRRLRVLQQELDRAGVGREQVAHALTLIAERASLLRRLAYLHRMKRWFDLWHVFHLPLVYLMLVIVTLHIGLVLYMGYVPFRW